MEVKNTFLLQTSVAHILWMFNECFSLFCTVTGRCECVFHPKTDQNKKRKFCKQT